MSSAPETAMTFAVGQMVVCLVQAASSCAAIRVGASFPNRGEIVTVRAVDEFTVGKVRLRFEEHLNEAIRQPGYLDVEPGFSPHHFRALDHERPAVARKLKADGKGSENIAVALFGRSDGMTIAAVRDLLREEG